MAAPVGPGVPEDRLRDIQSITDAALSRLDDDALLAELLQRARGTLQADTAVILRLDEPSGQLIATAAVGGLEEEVRQGVRIPLGKGFAGRIAAERRPVILDRVDPTTVVNPLLVSKGVRSLIGVPLVASGKIIGVLHLGSMTTRKFTEQDAELLQMAADRAAAAVLSILTQGDRAAAAALQRSLVPSALPEVAGAEMAARYVPGDGAVGGDWYDVFILPGGELGLVIGDVAGSGLEAATIMGRLRSALRAYALTTTDPAEVLTLLDRKLQHFEPDAMATVLYAVVSAGLDDALVSTAGHLPPVVAAPGRTGQLAAIAADAMIGVGAPAPRAATRVHLAAGSLLCFYTDGLVERPGEALDDGLARLCRAVSAQSPDLAAAAVMSAMVGTEPARDDIALLMFRRMPADPR